jgi:glycosyltransferase involved in cell wall biosynthesis
MATYNGEKFIDQQVKSILDQLSSNDELIVSDDHSTDNTIGILHSFNDARIKIIYNNGVKGHVGNFQNALSNAKGDYIFLADQDDIWFDNKVEVMISYLENYDVVCCDCEIVDENLITIAKSYYNYIGSGPGLFKNFLRNTYMGNCMAFKKEVLELALPIPYDIPNHDLWIGITADLFYKPYFIPQILGMHRRHDLNASNTFDIKTPTSFVIKIGKRVTVLKNTPRLFTRSLLKKISRN